jgi:hypothetical protein
VTLALIVLAAASKTPKVPKGGEGVKSGPIGLAVILVLCVAVYFLFKSMSKHLRKVREEFPTDAPDSRTAADHSDTGSAEVPTGERPPPGSSSSSDPPP